MADVVDFVDFVDNFSDSVDSSPESSTPMSGDISIPLDPDYDVATKRKQGRPKKYKNQDSSEITSSPLDPDYDVTTKRKRGRPKKYKNQDSSEIISSPLNPNNDVTMQRKRGRPRKNPSLTNHSDNGNHNDGKQFAVKRGRGRPRKISLANGSLGDQKKVIIKRVRGRPRGTTQVKTCLPASVKLHDILKRRSSKFLVSSDPALASAGPLRVTDHPQIVISKFCRQMYELGWATGTGGGMSVKQNGVIYMAPSGVQKEMIEPCDIFKCDDSGNIITEPESGLKLTECAPLFMNAYILRDAGAVIHSHAVPAVLATLLFKGDEFRISHMEMIKGIKKGSTSESLKYDDTLVVPIIENTLYERDLTERMRTAIERYPDTNAVLVRRHGVYIWGNSWQRAKSQAECYHFLFEAAIKMKQMGIDPQQEPKGEDGIEDIDL